MWNGVGGMRRARSAPYAVRMPLVRLTVVADEVEAEVVCGLLRTNGIACNYRSTDTAAGARDGAAGPVGPREIVVDEADLDAARELLPG